MKKIIAILCLMLILVPFAYSLKASVGNARAVIRVNATPEDPAIIPRTIHIENKNPIPVNVTLMTDLEFDKIGEVIDKSFIMQPGDVKKAAYILTIDRGGRFEGRINVAYAAEDPELKEAPVGLLSTVVVLSNGPIIEDPEPEPEPEPEETTDEQDLPEEVPPDEGEVEEEPEATEEDEPDAPVPDVQRTGASPVVGIAIMVSIIAVGLLGFFIVTKARK